MTERISALDHRPIDFVREVSPDALDFYVKGLRGLYMPESEQRFLDPSDRLHGKFGRYVLANSETSETFREILLMGTVVTLGPKAYGAIDSLLHFQIRSALINMVRRGEVEHVPEGVPIDVQHVDYGQTQIILGKDDQLQSVLVSGASFEFGRASEEGRQQTCELFDSLLEGTVTVVNANPTPETYDDIIQ